MQLYCEVIADYSVEPIEEYEVWYIVRSSLSEVSTVTSVIVCDKVHVSQYCAIMRKMHSEPNESQCRGLTLKFVMKCLVSLSRMKLCLLNEKEYKCN